MQYTVQDMSRIIEDLAPLDAAEGWDNVGLLIGDSERVVDRVVLSLDLDERALRLATEIDAQLIVTHHPVIFPSVDRLTTEIPLHSRILKAAAQGISIYSVHTNLDACPGGVNDALAAVIGLRVEDTILSSEHQDSPMWQSKLKTTESLSVLKGRFDVPVVPFGLGRTGTFPYEMRRRTLVRVVNNQLQTAGCILNFDEDADVNRVAIACGSFDEAWVPLLVEKRVDLLLTGEIKHHVMQALADLGIACIMAGHEATERVILHPLAEYLRLRTDALTIAVNEGLDYNKIVF